MSRSEIEHGIERRQILRVLVEVGFYPYQLELMRGVLDDNAIFISAESLDFHLRLMLEEGWVEIGEERVLGERPRILWAKITSAGVKEYDRQCREVVRLARRGPDCLASS
jgi:hypothetical protein